MGSLSPPQIAALIAGALALIGFIVILIQRQRTYAQYEEFAKEARTIVKALHGDVFRDADDLVMSGNFSSLPSIVRFSNSDTTPGLNILTKAPASFTLTVTPSHAAAGPGRAMGRTNDPQFDARFTIRSEHPAEARLFLTPFTLRHIKRLCCSSNTQLSVATGTVELSEMVIPAPGTAHHILEHLKDIGALAESLRAMPGGDAIKIEPFPRERHLIARIAIAAGAVAALVMVFSATSGNQRRTGPPPGPAATGGILPVDAVAMRNPQGWRVAEAEDFDFATLAWLRDNGMQPQGRLTGDFSGKGLGTDVAYLLVGPDGSRRVVLLSGGVARYDAQFDSLGGVALLPKDNASSVHWKGLAPETADGDGLVVVRNGADGASALAIFLHGNTGVMASPLKYDNIGLR